MFGKKRKEDFDYIVMLINERNKIFDIIQEQQEAIKALQNSITTLQELVLKNEEPFN